MAVCLFTGGNYHYSGLCDFSAIKHYTTIVAYAGLRDNITAVQNKNGRVCTATTHS